MSVKANSLAWPAIAMAAFLLPGQNAVAEEQELIGCSSIYGEQPRRRRPGRPKPPLWPCDDEGLAPAVWGRLPELAPVPDRWRIVSALGYPEQWWDPYNGNNALKGDRPVFGEDWFVSFNLISDSTFEFRSIPTPVAIATVPGPARST